MSPFGTTIAIVLVITAVLAIALLKESRRQATLREWVAARSGAKLHWPFVPGDNPSIPAPAMVEKLIRRQPLSWASAIHIADASGDHWWIEFRTTPAGKESTSWFTLVAHPGNAEPQTTGHDLSEPTAGWSYEQRTGLITVPMLEDWTGAN